MVFYKLALALVDSVDSCPDLLRMGVVVGKVPRNFLSTTLERLRRPRIFDIPEVGEVVFPLSISLVIYYL